MKNYKVKFDGKCFVYFNGVLLRERMIGEDDLSKPFKVIEFLRGSKVVAEFYPEDWFTFEIEEVPY